MARELGRNHPHLLALRHWLQGNATAHREWGPSVSGPSESPRRAIMSPETADPDSFLVDLL